MDVKFSKDLILWIVWFLLVVLWNYGFPNASPFLDVLIAVILSLLMIVYKDFSNKFVVPTWINRRPFLTGNALPTELCGLHG